MGKVKYRLKGLHPFITCKLCGGYLICATTITECLHTFCKTCIVKYLESHTTCPICEILIHQSHPLNYISLDRDIQDIVNKLVPGLQEKELRREFDFYRHRKLELPPHLRTPDSKESIDEQLAPGAECNFHRDEEHVLLSVCCDDPQITAVIPNGRRFISVSIHATILLLKKWLAKKLYQSEEKYKDIDIFCENELLGKDHTLMYVQRTKWRARNNEPLPLHYRKHVEF